MTPRQLPRTCPDCTGPVLTSDLYCEACGQYLDSASSVVECLDAPVSGRERQEIDIGDAAGVSDQGLRHSRNEDAMALLSVGGRAPHVLAVVCDGVSSAARANEASRAAARTGITVLADELKATRSPRAATHTALARATDAVADLEHRDTSPPACTYVSATVPQEGGAVTIGWSGDSRAYWLAASPTAGPSALLTRDDSWSEELVAMGAMTPEQARYSAHAHALTAWLGADGDPAGGHLTTVQPTGPGALVLCSDGLWNYLPHADELALAVPHASDHPGETARVLTQLALDAGGRDNITVVVIAIPAPREEPQ